MMMDQVKYKEPKQQPVMLRWLCQECFSHSDCSPSFQTLMARGIQGMEVLMS